MPDDLAPLAVFDLDGTLTDTRHRQHHLDVTPKAWDLFFAAAAGDGAHPEGLAAVQTAVRSGCDLVYLSGRPERLRRDTERWLRHHDCPPGELVLRPDRSRTSAVVFKLRQLRRLAAGRQLALLVDDDPAVVDAVRAHPQLVRQVLLADWQPRQPSTPQER